MWYTERRGRHVARLDRETAGGRSTCACGVAVRRHVRHGFAWSTLREANTVERIDPKTARACRSRRHQPAAGARRRRHLYVASYGDHTLVRIDPSTNRAEDDPVSVGLNPFALAADDDGRIWVTGVGDGTLSRVTWR